MKSTSEFEMMHNGKLELFEVSFVWEAWKDRFEAEDSSSEFWEWSHVMVSLSYSTEGNDVIKIAPAEYNALLPELKEFIEYNINTQIEHELY